LIGFVDGGLQVHAEQTRSRAPLLINHRMVTMSVTTEVVMTRVANIVSPGAEHLTPAQEHLAAGVTSGLVVTKMDVPLASDPLRLALKDLVYVEAAVRAAAAGYDAIFVNTVADYGLELMRSAVSIPVAGAGAAAIAEAGGLGDTFAIVTVWPSSTQIYYDRVLRDTGSRQRCRDIHYVLESEEVGEFGGGRAVMSQVEHAGTAVAQRVLRGCLDAVAAGADVVILGCTCMNGLAGWLGDNLKVPVVNPLRAGHKAAERAAREAEAGRAAGPAPNPDTVARVLAAVEAMAPMGASVTSAWTAADGAPECGDACAVIA
jgi:allantoin racemase